MALDFMMKTLARITLYAFGSVAILIATGCDSSPQSVDSEDPPILVVRTDFSDNGKWESIKATILTPIEPGYTAHVEFMEIKNSGDRNASEIARNISPFYQPSFIFVADKKTFESGETTLLIASLSADSQAEFRLLPSLVAEVEANLSIANVSFEEFAETLDKNVIYRGY